MLRIWKQPIRLLRIDTPEFSQSCKDSNGWEYKCGIEPFERDCWLEQGTLQGGTNLRPAEYRENGWVEATEAAKPESGSECVVKGNINRKGGKIYHTPWNSRHYKRTKIDPSKGERGLCVKAEALAAGWWVPRR